MTMYIYIYTFIHTHNIGILYTYYVCVKVMYTGMHLLELYDLTHDAHVFNYSYEFVRTGTYNKVCPQCALANTYKRYDSSSE